MISLAWEGDWPVTQPFGAVAPGYTAIGLAGHNGLDIGCPPDTWLRSVCHGTVVEVAHDPQGYGYYVKVRSTTGEDWLYAHCQLWDLPRPGDVVEPGQHLCRSGNSGWSTGPHLHLGYRPYHRLRGHPYNGYMDPVPHLG